ncbi:MAG TPA: serine hydrolase [Cyclobacteriaceae bacterium]|nr:serine hydrolase [Cyclobacteriaceae bacterium]
MKPILPLLLIFVVSLAFGQTDKRLKNYDAIVNKVMTDWKVQGIAVAIVEKNKVVYAKGYGFRDVEKKLPVTPTTQFAIGSCTKAFTAATVCLLKEDNVIDLDQPVRKYLPSFALYDEYASNNMTPRDLLCHRSGLPRHDMLWYGSTASRKELVAALKYLQPSKPFRTMYQYQNLMFMTAGYLVGELSGQSWESFAKQRLIDKMGMSSTNFSIIDMEKAADHSLGYIERDDKVEVIPYMNIDGIGPAGSINSTATDMSKWLITLINGGKYNGQQILSTNTIREIQTPTMVAPAVVPLPYDENGYATYGLGWSISSYRGHIRVEHGGNIDGFSASTCFLPKDSLGIVVLTNMNGSASTGIVRNYTIDKLLGLSEVDWNGRLLADAKKAKDNAAKTKKAADADHVAGTSPSHALKSYVGKYEHPGYGIVEISMNGEDLVVDVHGLKSKLKHYHYDYFEAVDEQYFDHEKINFSSDIRGTVDKLFIKLEPAVDDIVFERKPEISALTMDQMKKYIGDYDFNGVAAKVYARQEKTLFLFVTGQPEYELSPSKANEFTCKELKGFVFRFNVDGQGNVTELVSNQPNGVYTAKRK